MDSDLFVNGDEIPSGKLPLLFIFDLDYTLWPLWVDTLEPPFKASPSELHTVRDKYNYEIKLFPDVPRILNFIRKNIPNSKIAVASRTDKPEWARKILSLMSFPVQQEEDAIASLNELFDFAEIYPGSKLTHMKALRNKSGIAYDDMIFFDDEIRNNEVEISRGIRSSLAENATFYDTVNVTSNENSWNFFNAENFVATAESLFQNTPLAGPDKIFHLTAVYASDEFPQKINLGVGAYRDNDGKPWVLPVVKKAEDILINDPNRNHEYLPITGLPTFRAASAKLILGADSPAIKENRVSTCQTISGTGANHLGVLFLSRFYRNDVPVLISKPTWINHRDIVNNVGLEVREYAYYDPKTNGLDIDGFLKSLNDAPNGSIALLHACAHNPTGVDPSQEQWRKIADVIAAKGHYPFFDCAYQGFASGDLDRDAWAVRYFVERGFELLVCQSYSKNFGLYGQRTGCLTVVSKNADAAVKIESQIAKLQRAEVSNPPAYGARIVNLVLHDPKLYAEWNDNLRTMSSRIMDMRKQLYDKLIELGTPGTWNHIIDQIGMFSFTGLKPSQVQVLIQKYHIYLTDNGRISMAGLSTKNIDYFAKAVNDVVRNVE
ncbi:13592_t:CDS:10 [Ambispora leptoticha]|uniref:aspartate transaminase n=1 Tax=Ambispora leptoticha TaxID=144679 RepID=A0A9N8VND6_9GLOM|nr:13592_t:CDS:10 [Ambispora leptoticha]